MDADISSERVPQHSLYEVLSDVALMVGRDTRKAEVVAFPSVTLISALSASARKSEIQQYERYRTMQYAAAHQPPHP